MPSGEARRATCSSESRAPEHFTELSKSPSIILFFLYSSAKPVRVSAQKGIAHSESSGALNPPSNLNFYPPEREDSAAQTNSQLVRSQSKPTVEKCFMLSD